MRKPLAAVTLTRMIELALLDLEHLPQISLGTAAILIFIVCATLVFVRGLTRIFVGSIVIAISAWVAFWAWQSAPAIGIHYAGQPLRWLAIVWPLFSGLLTFFVLRTIVRFLISPFRGKSSEPMSTTRRAFNLLFTLVPAGLLCLVAAMIVHHAGSVAEIRHFAGASHGDTGYAQWFSSLKSSVENALPPSLIQALDPATDRSRVNLAKLISAFASNDVPPKAIVVMEEPVLRAIIVEEKELRGLAREKRYGTLLSHPYLDKALTDPRVRKAIDRLDLD